MNPLVIVITALIAAATSGAEQTTWHIVLGPEHAEDEAIRCVIADLQAAGAELGVNFVAAEDGVMPQGFNCIVVGDTPRNRMTATWAEQGLIGPLISVGSVLSNDGLRSPPHSETIHPSTFQSSEGYSIQTLHNGDLRNIVVCGASLIGDVYGLYWIWDRLRVHKNIPDINVVREPNMGIRLGAAWGRNAYGGSTPEQMRTALRHSFNWVSGPAILDLVPWSSEPEAEENARNREAARELIDYAHSLHMKYYAFANAFTYHPSLLEEFEATLSPCDPRFWNAVQEKYRRLLQALPELDGISLCNDDISGFWGTYLPFDVTREAPECDWSYVKRFHTFVRKVHEVVAGEFDKTYFHFTWGLREHEVHCQPEVFRAIFNEEIPTNNLYLMPKITRGDRWWHQPYNATFNQTPHDTIVLFETMNYYESGSANIFPTFSGQYFQRGLQTFLTPENTNVRGAAALAGAPRDAWGTTGAYSYVLYRLMWNANTSVKEIARDFCAIHFGPEAAEGMAEIYLMSPSAYKYGLHIEPISYGQFNSFLHMRVGTFPAEGYPAIDNGKEHLAFLRRVYQRCDPWRQETLRALDQGLDTATRMVEAYAAVRPRIKDDVLAQDLADRLQMTRNLIRTNIGYVNTMFAYFDYLDKSSSENREALAQAHASFAAAKDDFVNTPGFSYQLFGVDVLLDKAAEALEDMDRARLQLIQTPNQRELEVIIADQQQRYRDVLETHKDRAVRFARFEVLVDGQDMLLLQDDTWRIEHLRWDHAHVEVGDILAPLPREAVTVVPMDIQSRPMHPFVLEQPCAANDYTARIYLDDAPGGHGWVIFDLYYIPDAPETLGLQVPWTTR